MNKKTVLIVSPHPDDETLGAGGTLFVLKERGYDLHWLNMTNVNVNYNWSETFVSNRKEEILKISDHYGFVECHDLGLRPAGLDQYPVSDLIKKMSIVIAKVQPEILIIPWKNDPHTDHKITYHCAVSCTKSFRNKSIKRLLAMEILSETNFADRENLAPNYFVDISDSLDYKIDAMCIYTSEIEDHPFPRSTEAIKALAILRGTQAGCSAAEAFRIIRWID